MALEDRQRVIETNRSLRVIKNELESLLEKGVITDAAFDSIHALLPAESPLSGSSTTAAAARSNSTTTPAAAASPAPAQTPTPATNPNSNHNAVASPPSYAQSTATPPALPHRNTPADKPVLAHARALYRYAAADARDVAFERDDRLAVHEYMNADWWMGRNLRTGQEGIFPRNYVVVEEDTQMKAAAPVPMPAPMGYQQPQYAPPPHPQQQQHYPVTPVPVSGYPAPPPPGPAAAFHDPHQQQQDGGGSGSKIGEHGKKFGKKLGNAAIFGAGATIGSNIVNSIF